MGVEGGAGVSRREEKTQSGREDLNLRPLAPHASALAGLRHAPICADYSRNWTI